MRRERVADVSGFIGQGHVLRRYSQSGNAFVLASVALKFHMTDRNCIIDNVYTIAKLPTTGARAHGMHKAQKLRVPKGVGPLL